MNEWRVVDERTTDVPSDISIQRRHWHPLSVHLWGYWTHPTHDVTDVMSEGWETDLNNQACTCLLPLMLLIYIAERATEWSLLLIIIVIWYVIWCVVQPTLLILYVVYCNMSVANSAEVIKTQRLFSSRSYDSSNEENDSVDSICSGEGDSESDYDQNSDEEDCFCVASDTESSKKVL